MSILSAATTQPAPTILVSALLFAVVAGVWVTIGNAAGVLNPRSVLGPRRIGPDESVGRLLLILILGAVAYLIVPNVYAGLRMMHAHKPAATEPASTQPEAPQVVPAPPPSPIALSGTEVVLVSTAAAAVAFVVLVSATALRRTDGLRRLGLTTQRFLPGVARGALGIILVLPIVYLASALTEAIWSALHKSHPAEHELLKILGESPSTWLKVAIAVSAVLVAPLAEETLFRGYLQTVIGVALAKLAGEDPARDPEDPSPGGAGFPVLPPANELPPPPGMVQASKIAVVVPTPGSNVPYVLPYDGPPIPRAVWPRWVAIAITALLFALVHPWWMRPQIFCLAICLGYAYERTGNLWTNITIHALFNGMSVLLFLLLGAG